MLKRSKGFTLTELMITLAIIALVAAVAIPSYNKSVVKTRRSDAKIGLSQLSQLQETYYVDNHTYTEDFSNLGSEFKPGGKYFRNGKYVSPEGYYELSGVKVSDPTKSFMLRAVPLGAQKENDKDCQEFTLDSANQKGSTPTADCWK